MNLCYSLFLGAEPASFVGWIHSRPRFGPKFLIGAAPISHGDPDAAVALLEEAGWTLNLSMKREKEREELAVRMVTYPTAQASRSCSP